MADVQQLLSLIIGTLKSIEGQSLVSNSSEVDDWLKFASSFGVGSEFEGACAYANSYLTLRTFLVGNELTIADITVVAYLAGAGPRWESFRKSSKFPNLVRWYNCILAQYAAIADVLPRRGSGKPAAEVSKPSSTAAAPDEAKEKVDGSFEVDLPGAEMGKVCTRFPPEPSGYLHIGHAKAALLNQFFAQKYKGRLIIRFDDTNPAKEKDEFVESILHDLETLGVKGDVITYTSDYFPQLMEMCEKLIKEGKAYVDDTEREQMQTERKAMIESKCRNQSVEENLILWKEMIAGSPRGVQCCVRAKMDMSNPNASLRDPVYYRCNPAPHLRVGSKYKVYPTYDFACPYVDSIEGVTHALRSSEYHDRNDQYYRVLEDMQLRKVHVWDFSRLNFVYTLLSKRKLQWFVDNGRVEGWNDPRFPTVQGIIRRGLTIEALKQFILSQGASKNLNLMEWDKLWTINKKIIDPICPRHTAVLSEGKVLLDLSNGPETPFTRVILRHKKYEPAGKKASVFTKRIWLDHADATAVSEGEEVTLMDWGNCFIRKVERDQYGLVTRLQGELHVEGSVKTTKLKLTWLPEFSELVPVTLVDLDHLIVKKKLEENDDFVSVLNPVTRIETSALGDSNMRNLQRGEIIQLERKGYYICDVPFLRSSKPIVLISIPDGRQQKPPGPQ
ncbi:glutamate--tRNA ligase, cytoplasmic [Physcomitrium patens]|uniref:glutamate--tRNA ligase n=2 Tax=Physcomitrium patens TaxID=3218 RepID=A0A2K1IEL1_PHYPA|nr:glutamate--tRNA ligase, cytoplasmic-like [Physcomitrium patens]PNR27717.1 hypothetical protein PHYPA_029869 [Physcomitrium patens]|eukprot:XP_024365597.1 glutamate--tRNA ligase, cytoplasmic-like [Physcomitrella patens]